VVPENNPAILVDVGTTFNEDLGIVVPIPTLPL
jgi:hypothetical protein